MISVHQNFHPIQAARGGQVFYNGKDEAGKRFALAVQEKLNALYKEEGVKERKITAAEYFMLECYPCPSLIVECGFLSNGEDEALLSTSVWQKQLAKGIAGGVLGYFAGAVA